uniref:Golgi-associated, gamma adaptin ear containing, ARF binding protein 1 n=1 Tax=Callorhinchus milii TaxID=7868 RepID=A0A4W3HYG3_CALMI
MAAAAQQQRRRREDGEERQQEEEAAEESLESRLNKATNPLNRDLEWDYIQAFCDQLNKELEGPQLATRFLAHKIQSPQEWEAVQALTVLETCMKNCGKRFHSEVGKFRFLNELIKVVSPKYLGTRAPEKVKTKVLELMFSWTVGLPDELKITEAYQMLKKQGILKQDPVLPDDQPLPLLPPRPKNAIFEDDEKSKLLARLLKSSHPEDLRAANKLIKEMVQEDQKRMEKISKRVNAIEEVNSNVKLLSEMLDNYKKEETSESNEEIMKLYQRCEKMRPTLFRLASDTEDNDEALGKCVGCGNEADSLLSSYPDLSTPQQKQTLRDLKNKSNASSSAALGESPLFTALPTRSVSPVLASGACSTDFTAPFEQPLPFPYTPPGHTALHSTQTSHRSPSLPPLEISLANVVVPLESIKPSSILPVTVYDRNSFRVLFHFAKDSPPGQPQVLVVVTSMISTAPQPVKNIRFQAAVPKVMKVKLQHPSGTELPAFNPVLPPSAITQVLLLANPQKEKVRLRYKLTFTFGEQTYNEMGDVDDFPSPQSWGSL